MFWCLWYSRPQNKLDGGGGCCLREIAGTFMYMINHSLEVGHQRPFHHYYTVLTTTLLYHCHYYCTILCYTITTITTTSNIPLLISHDATTLIPQNMDAYTIFAKPRIPNSTNANTTFLLTLITLITACHPDHSDSPGGGEESRQRSYLPVGNLVHRVPISNAISSSIYTASPPTTSPPPPSAYPLVHTQQALRASQEHPARLQHPENPGRECGVAIRICIARYVSATTVPSGAQMNGWYSQKWNPQTTTMVHRCVMRITIQIPRENRTVRFQSRSSRDLCGRRGRFAITYSVDTAECRTLQYIADTDQPSLHHNPGLTTPLAINRHQPTSCCVACSCRCAPRPPPRYGYFHVMMMVGGLG